MIASYQIKYQRELNNQSEYEKGDGEQSEQIEMRTKNKEFYYSSGPNLEKGLKDCDPIYCSFENSCKVYSSQLGLKLTRLTFFSFV